jgi:hypothetical protein
MNETPERLAMRLETEAEKTAEFFHRLDPQMWEKTVYEGGIAWNTRHLLAHFVSTEAAFGKLISDVLKGGKGAPEDLVIDDFNRQEVAGLSDTSPSDLLASFLEYRTGNIKLVRGMQEADLERVGRHPFLGTVKLEEIIKLVYRHNQIHLREMRHTGLFDN